MFKVQRVLYLWFLALGILPSALWIQSVSADDDLPKLFSLAPTSCKTLIQRTASHLKKKDTSTHPFEFYDRVKKHAERLVFGHIQRIERTVIVLYEKRDELLNRGLSEDSDQVRAIQREIDKTTREPLLSRYRARIREWKRLQKEIEDLTVYQIQDLIETPTVSSVGQSKFEKRRTFRPSWVLKASLGGLLAIPITGGVVVPGGSALVKLAAEEAEARQIGWAQSILPASSSVPTYKEVFTYAVEEVLFPSSDWTWDVYGNRAVEEIMNLRKP